MEKTAAKSIYTDAEKLYMEEKNAIAALNYLELALEKDDALAPAYFLTGKILYEEANDYNASMYYFDNAVITGNGVEDSIGSYYFWRGKNRLKLKEYGLAINDLEAAYAYLNNNTELILSIADTYLYKLNLYDKAILFYDEALSLEPNDFDALLGKGVTLQKKIAYEDASSFLEQAQNIKPQAGEVYYYLGLQALSFNKDTSQACSYWEKAFNLGVQEALVQNKKYCISPTLNPRE
ncbi:MAG: tetratricopeptide repeat protein [Leptolyngbya sp. SIO3F4]|nr:tetratricopeptide repeat protein [Leptolyngbya sp. SIO3F4]